MAKKPAAKARVTEATLSASAAGGIGARQSLSEQIEEAQARATREALRNGITDPNEILKLKLAAREQMKAKARGGIPGARVG